MPKLTYSHIADDTLQALSPPRPLFFLVLAAFGGGIALFGLAWYYQVRTGMGVSGISHPVSWGVYIANFVFWVGIAHSGTLISAILHLVRAKWRDSVSRAAEAMTVFAIMVAGLFPLVHLGRLWVFYYILPYPSQRQVWPNFTSPLVFDVLAVSTYFTVSLVFFYVGLIPDMAAARDRFEQGAGPDHWRSRLYRGLALGWSGSSNQWRHYDRSYLFFAALATPLVISVHSIVSWDFAVGILPGWHTTIFAPYFVAGAIHSGLAMVLLLLIPMRKLLRLERLLTPDHFDKVALTLLATTAIMGYSYVVEPFIQWYTGEVFEQQFAWWRMTAFDRPMGWLWWSMILLNVFIPAAFIFRRVRRSQKALLLISVAVVLGMWIERYVIVTGSTARDFLPHNWGTYFPSLVETCITFGSASVFFFLFFAFIKLLPVVPMSDLKDHVAEEQMKRAEPGRTRGRTARREQPESSVLAVFPDAGQLIEAVGKVCDEGFTQIETFSPVKLPEVQKMLGQFQSPVRYWTLLGALAGLAGGFALAIGAATVNDLIVGGKHPIALIPYFIVGFEGTILIGSLANMAGLLFFARLYRLRTSHGFDRRFSHDRFGLKVECSREELDIIRKLLSAVNPEELHVER